MGFSVASSTGIKVGALVSSDGDGERKLAGGSVTVALISLGLSVHKSLGSSVGSSVASSVGLAAG